MYSIQSAEVISWGRADGDAVGGTCGTGETSSSNGDSVTKAPTALQAL